MSAEEALSLCPNRAITGPVWALKKSDFAPYHKYGQQHWDIKPNRPESYEYTKAV